MQVSENKYISPVTAETNSELTTADFDQHSCNSLIKFLQSGPKLVKAEEEQTLNSGSATDNKSKLEKQSRGFIKQFKLPNDEAISCVKWDGEFYITSTDIIRSLVYRFENINRPVTHMKKFEEGVFSDLRSLKPGQGARLESPRSEFLHLLYRNHCVRTQKKQKVFYWYLVPHDQLFREALERDLKREAMGIDTTTKLKSDIYRNTIVNIGGVDLPLTIPREISVDKNNSSQGANKPENNPKDVSVDKLKVSAPFESKESSRQNHETESRKHIASIVNMSPSLSDASLLTNLSANKNNSSADGNSSSRRDVSEYHLLSGSLLDEENLPEIVSHRPSGLQQGAAKTKRVKSPLASSDLNKVRDLVMSASSNINYSEPNSLHEKSLAGGSLNEFINSLQDLGGDFSITLSPNNKDISTLFDEIKSTNIGGYSKKNIPTKDQGNFRQEMDFADEKEDKQSESIIDMFEKGINGNSHQFFSSSNDSFNNGYTNSREPKLNLDIPKFDLDFGSQFSSRFPLNAFHPYKKNKSKPAENEKSAYNDSSLRIPDLSFNSNLFGSSKDGNSKNNAQKSSGLLTKKLKDNYSNTSKPESLPYPETMNSNSLLASQKNANANIPAHERRYICEYSGCDKQFKRHEHLKRHIRTHTGEKPYKCPLQGCEKEFARMDNLHQHVRTHINRRAGSSNSISLGSVADSTMGYSLNDTQSFNLTEDIGSFHDTFDIGSTLSSHRLNIESLSPELMSPKFKAELGVGISRVKSLNRVQKQEITRRRTMRSTVINKGNKGNKLVKPQSIKDMRLGSLIAESDFKPRIQTSSTHNDGDVDINQSISAGNIDISELGNIDIHPIRRWSTMPVSAHPQISHTESSNTELFGNQNGYFSGSINPTEITFKNMLKTKNTDSESTSSPTQNNTRHYEDKEDKFSVFLPSYLGNDGSKAYSLYSELEDNANKKAFTDTIESAFLSNYPHSLPNAPSFDWISSGLEIPQDFFSIHENQSKANVSAELANLHEQSKASHDHSSKNGQSSSIFLERSGLFNSLIDSNSSNTEKNNSSKFFEASMSIFNKGANFFNSEDHDKMLSSENYSQNDSYSASNGESKEDTPNLSSIAHINYIHKSDGFENKLNIGDSQFIPTSNSNTNTFSTNNYFSSKPNHDLGYSTSFYTSATNGFYLPGKNNLSNNTPANSFPLCKNIDQFFGSFNLTENEYNKANKQPAAENSDFTQGYASSPRKDRFPNSFNTLSNTDTLSSNSIPGSNHSENTNIGDSNNKRNNLPNNTTEGLVFNIMRDNKDYQDEARTNHQEAGDDNLFEMDIENPNIAENHTLSINNE